MLPSLPRFVVAAVLILSGFPDSTIDQHNFRAFIIRTANEVDFTLDAARPALAFKMDRKIKEPDHKQRSPCPDQLASDLDASTASDRPSFCSNWIFRHSQHSICSCLLPFRYVRESVIEFGALPFFLFHLRFICFRLCVSPLCLLFSSPSFMIFHSLPSIRLNLSISHYLLAFGLCPLFRLCTAFMLFFLSVKCTLVRFYGAFCTCPSFPHSLEMIFALKALANNTLQSPSSVTS